jgi:hypothetical protein
VIDRIQLRGWGGYSAESWNIHADAIEGILTRFDRG